MIVAAILGSTITLLITAVIDYFKEKYRYKMEKHKLVFQRKTDAAEKAMSWYQEGADCLMMMQSACSDMEATFNPITSTKLIQSANQANQLYKETSLRLNPLYLYFDFRKIEEKHNVYSSMNFINETLAKIGEYGERAKQLRLNGKDDDSNDILELKSKSFSLFNELSKAFQDQIESIAAIQEELRKQYNKYSN